MDQDPLIHPGEILREEFLAPHGLKPHGLATRLGVPPDAITAIVNGTRGVSGPMSKLLGHVFGVSEDFFATLQMRYEMDRAAPDAARDGKAAERLRRSDAPARESSVA